MANNHFVYTASEHNLRDDFPFVLSHWVHDPKTYIPIHSHEFIEVTLVVDGQANHIFQAPISGSYEHTVKKGDILLINPGEEHTFRIDDNNKIEVINLLFYSNIIDWTMIRDSEYVYLMDFFYVQPFLPADIRFGNTLRLNDHEAQEIYPLFKNIEYEYNSKKESYKLLIKLMMTQLMILLGRKFAEQKSQNLIFDKSKVNKCENIQRVLGYIERHYNEEITVEQLAKLCICSTRQLTRVFKQFTGDTIVNYLHKLRIEKAKLLLRYTDSKISNASTMVGFNDISFFNKTFKRICGLSPREYRNQYSQAGSINNDFIGTLDLDRQ